MTDKSRRVYSGRIIDLDVESVTLPNGTELEIEIIRHPGGAAVVALNDETQVCLLHQYRHVAGGYLWELPAGKIDDEEPPLETARRELADEAGVLAAQWQDLGNIASSPGVFAEVVHLYLARQLKLTNAKPEADEVLEVHWIPFDQALRWAVNGKIRDAKSLIGLFRANEIISSNET